jgi:hypothetical protein
METDSCWVHADVKAAGTGGERFFKGRLIGALLDETAFA